MQPTMHKEKTINERNKQKNKQEKKSSVVMWVEKYAQKAEKRRKREKSMNIQVIVAGNHIGGECIKRIHP